MGEGSSVGGLGSFFDALEDAVLDVSTVLVSVRDSASPPPAPSDVAPAPPPNQPPNHPRTVANILLPLPPSGTSLGQMVVSRWRALPSPVALRPNGTPGLLGRSSVGEGERLERRRAMEAKADFESATPSEAGSVRRGTDGSTTKKMLFACSEFQGSVKISNNKERKGGEVIQGFRGFKKPTPPPPRLKTTHLGDPQRPRQHPLLPPRPLPLPPSTFPIPQHQNPTLDLRKSPPIALPQTRRLDRLLVLELLRAFLSGGGGDKRPESGEPRMGRFDAGRGGFSRREGGEGGRVRVVGGCWGGERGSLGQGVAEWRCEEVLARGKGQWELIRGGGF